MKWADKIDLPRVELPDWAEQNIALREARKRMNQVKRIEQHQRQFHQQTLGVLCGPMGRPLPEAPYFGPPEPAVAVGLDRDTLRDAWIMVGEPRDTRPRRCVAGL